MFGLILRECKTAQLGSSFFSQMKYSLIHKAKKYKKILFVGRLGKRKGINTLLEAIPKVLSKTHNLEFIIAGKDEWNRYEDWCKNRYGEEYFTNVKFLGYVNNSELERLYKECDIFVSNDSGLMHLAAVLRVPVVGLFGPTSPIKNGPWGSGHKILMSDYECAPCWAPGYRGCENGDCMKRISVDSAYNAISEKMQSKLTLS